MPASVRPSPAAEEHDRLPALDGLRGIAVLLVMVYHFSYGWYFSASPVDAAYARVSALGWMGVDLFFVLSGFLITGILHDSRERAGYFSSFYARRFLRIFPLYYVFVLLVLPGAAHLLASDPSRAVAALHAKSGWYLGYAVNFMLALRGGWSAAVLYTGHLWSLAVEEQFYFVWPPLVLLLSRRALIRTSAVLVAVALLARVAMRLGGAGEVATYVLPFGRMDALLLGALVALAVRELGSVAPLARHAPRVLAVSGTVAAATLAWAPARMSWSSPAVQTVGLTAIAVFFAALLVTAVAAPEASRWGRVLRAPSLRTFGKYSYALYILHPLVLAVLQANGWGASRFAGFGAGVQVGVHLVFAAFATLVSLGMAWLSWNLMEKHFLRLKHRFATRPRAAAPELAPVPGAAAPAL
jgi:peptidoglycan/LPS O-acetylase OafA/YrhL